MNRLSALRQMLHSKCPVSFVRYMLQYSYKGKLCSFLLRNKDMFTRSGKVVLRMNVIKIPVSWLEPKLGSLQKNHPLYFRVIRSHECYKGKAVHVVIRLEDMKTSEKYVLHERILESEEKASIIAEIIKLCKAITNDTVTAKDVIGVEGVTRVYENQGRLMFDWKYTKAWLRKLEEIPKCI